jgi:hypothetical protein
MIESGLRAAPVVRRCSRAVLAAYGTAVASPTEAHGDITRIYTVQMAEELREDLTQLRTDHRL